MSQDDPGRTRFDVIHVIDSLSIGGAQRLLTILAARGACPVVLNLEGKPSAMADALVALGTRIRPLGVTRPLYPLDWLRVWRGLAALPAPIVHLHLTNSLVIAAPIARLQGRRIVVTLHNTRTVPARKLLSRLKFRLETAILRHLADHVILVGPRVAEANRLRLGKTPRTTLANVIAAQVPAPDARARLRAHHGTHPEEVLFVSTGRLNRQKDHETMLRAFALLRGLNLPVALWILGEGPDRGRLETLAAGLGLGASCLFLGGHSDVADHLAAADVFVMSSAWEGLPLGLLEAMAAGLPVVATAVGDLLSVLGSEGGLLVGPGNPAALAGEMARVARDEGLRGLLGQRARDIAQPYLDAEGWVARVRAIYDEVLARSGRR